MASDIPVWLGGSAEAVSAATALWLGIRSVRAENARTWPALLETISKLSTEQLRTAVEDHPWVAEVVGLAWEEAARTSNDQKRRLLARVAAGALRYGPFTDKVDGLPFLIRTVANLEPPHVQVMMATATAASSNREPRSKNPERAPLMEHDLGPLTAPIYGQLQREGLMDFTGKIWHITEYGWDFLAYLAEDEPGARVAYVDFYALSRDGRTGTLILINYGASPATLTDVNVTFYDPEIDQGGTFIIQDFTPCALQQNEKCRLSFELPERVSDSYPLEKPRLTIQLQWVLDDGNDIRAERMLEFPSFDDKSSWRRSRVGLTTV